MKDIFDIKRFTNYFAFELRRSWNTIGFSAIITGLLPILFFAVFEGFCKLFTGEWAGHTGLMAAQWSAFAAVFFVTVIAFPTKLYGDITEKRYATDFLTLPVSTFEKWLSIAGMCFVVIPFVMGVLSFGSDSILNAVVSAYGDPALRMLSSWSETLTTESEGVISISLITTLYTALCQSLLLFTLGAIFFKKGKPAKTILVCFVISSVVSSILIPILTDESVLEMIQSDFASKLNFWNNFQSILWYVLLLGGIYARLKTLKQ